MSSFRRLLGYMANYRGLVALAIIFNILTAVFTVVSIPVLIPFLDILFDNTKAIVEAPEQVSSSASGLALVPHGLQKTNDLLVSGFPVICPSA